MNEWDTAMIPVGSDADDYAYTEFEVPELAYGFNFVFEDSQGNKVWDVNLENARLPETVAEQYASLPPPERTPEILNADAKEKLKRLRRENARLDEEIQPKRLETVLQFQGTLFNVAPFTQSVLRITFFGSRQIASRPFKK